MILLVCTCYMCEFTTCQSYRMWLKSGMGSS